MWYLEGDWKSNGTGDSAKFEESLKSLDTRQVMIGLSKGLELILRDNGKDDLNAIGISLNDDKLFVRRLTKKLNETNGKTQQSLIDKLASFFSVDRKNRAH